MIAIEILDQLDDIRTQAINYQCELVLVGYSINNLLEGTSAMLVDGNLKEVIQQ